MHDVNEKKLILTRNNFILRIKSNLIILAKNVPKLHILDGVCKAIKFKEKNYKAIKEGIK